MPHLVGAHYIPVHNWPTDREYIGRLQPRSIKIVDPDVQQISDLYKLVPTALFVLRNHPISEQHDDVKNDPVGTGIRHARELDAWVKNFRKQAAERGLPFPPNVQIIVTGINEIKVWENLTECVQYYVALCDEATRLGLRILASNMSVGWPGNLGADTPPDWAPFEPLRLAILRGAHMLGFHEYFGQQGPQFMFGWWFGRIFRCPWHGPEWKDRFLCGELGMVRSYQDDKGDWHLDGGTGWFKLVNGDVYINMLTWALQKYHDDYRIFDAEIFTTDGQTKDWGSFYTQDLHDELVLLARMLDVPRKAKGPTAIVNVPDGANIRTGPGVTYAALGALVPGTSMPITGRNETADWWVVDSPFGKAWVSAAVVHEEDLNIKSLPVVTADGAPPPPPPAPRPSRPPLRPGVIDPLVLEAIMQVESGGNGYGEDDKLKIRFEAHILRQELGNDALFDAHFTHNRGEIWKDHFWRRWENDSWLPIHTGSQEAEYAALDFAMTLDRDAALRSISMGAPQVMGFNYERLGYVDAEEMFWSFQRSATNQSNALFNYVLSDAALEDAVARRDWTTITVKYNGAGNIAEASAKYQAAYEKLVG